MTALELAHVGPRMRRHAPVAEYDAYLERWIDQPVYRRMLSASHRRWNNLTSAA